MRRPRACGLRIPTQIQVEIVLLGMVQTRSPLVWIRRFRNLEQVPLLMLQRLRDAPEQFVIYFPVSRDSAINFG